MRKEVSIRSKITKILKRNDVIKAGLFGSYAKRKANNKSDVDILIKYKGNKSLLDLVGLKLELEKELKKKVDLLTYNSINPLLKVTILKEEIKIL